MKHALLYASCMAITSVSSAQFPVVGSTDLWMLAGLTSLEVAGEKFIGWGPNGSMNDTTYIYNLDLSIYRKMPLPPLQPGWGYSHPMYVTESLFDNDPSTIEYVVAAMGNGTGLYHTRVFREDGTLLFNASSSQLQSNGLWMPAIISTTIAGSYMVLHNLNTGTTVYQLPGQLPCIECSPGLATSGGNYQFAPFGANMLAFPNPASGQTTITYGLPDGETRGDLVFFDPRGAEVQRLPVNRSGTVTVSLAQLPPATYLVQLETSKGVISTTRVVVVKYHP